MNEAVQVAVCPRSVCTERYWKEKDICHGGIKCSSQNIFHPTSEENSNDFINRVVKNSKIGTLG